VDLTQNLTGHLSDFATYQALKLRRGPGDVPGSVDGQRNFGVNGQPRNDS
jgi:hypothetical protein